MSPDAEIFITNIICLFFVFGLSLLVISGIREFFRHRAHLRDPLYAVAEGKVIKVDEIRKTRSVQYVSTYELIAKDGSIHHFRYELVLSRKPKKGDIKMLLYRVSDPDECEPRDTKIGLYVALGGLLCSINLLYAATRVAEFIKASYITILGVREQCL